MAIIAGLLAVMPVLASDGPPALAEAEALYAAGRYRAAVEALERVVDVSPDLAHAHYLMGLTQGRLAQHEPWHRAVIHARRCGQSLARAVELDPAHRSALRALARFYEEAPSLVGGGADKAVAIRARLEALSGD